MILSDPSKAIAPVLRWTARLTSLACFSLLLLFVSNPAKPPTASEMVALAFFPMGMLVGFGISWWRERLGAYVSLGSLGCFYAWMLFTRGYIPNAPYFAILAGPAVLFLMGSHLKERSERNQAACL